MKVLYTFSNTVLSACGWWQFVSLETIFILQAPELEVSSLFFFPADLNYFI